MSVSVTTGTRTGTTIAAKVGATTVLKAMRDAKYKLPLHPYTGD